jgi:hypothetical protein
MSEVVLVCIHSWKILPENCIHDIHDIHGIHGIHSIHGIRGILSTFDISLLIFALEIFCPFEIADLDNYFAFVPLLIWSHWPDSTQCMGRITSEKNLLTGRTSRGRMMAGTVDRNTTNQGQTSPNI